jgi:hypothetical protein
MNSKLVILTIGTWFLFMILAIINAGIRNGVFKSKFGDLVAHQISTIIFILLILFVTYFVFRFSNIELSNTESIFIGLIWLISTIIFEFIAGHYAFGNSWDKLFADYNIIKGRIWSLVLITILFAPYITKRLLLIK